MSGSYVLRLAEVGRADLAVAGGKGANLGELIRLGVAVPPGFVVSTAAYAAHVRAADVDLDPALSPDVRRARVERPPLPAAVEEAVRQAYAALGAGAVAVRSSAPAEDLPGAAFAGQQDTLLNVTGPDAVLAAVRRCWGSLFTERAVAYRRRRGVEEDAVSIAVVVQAMVAAEAAGVLFTANPLTGARDEAVIDATWGLGEALVSGEVTPEHLVLDATDRVRQRQPGRYERVVRADPAGGTRTVEPSGSDAAVLSDRLAAELAGLGRRIAARFGVPQDIEWAWDVRSLWIVQARPLTALPPAPRRVNRLRRMTGAIVVELLPVRPYPLDMSTWTSLGHGRILVRMLREIGGLDVDLNAVLPEVGGVVTEVVPLDPRPTWRTPLTPLRMAPRIRRFPVRDWQRDPRFADYEATIAALDALELSGLDWSELLRLPRRALAALDRLIDLRIDYLPGAGAAVIRLAVLLTVHGLGSWFGDLLTGARTRTSDANAALRALTDTVRERPEWRTAFEETAAAGLAVAVEEDERFAELRPRWRTFLAEYGHRETTSAFVMSEPTWRDDPAVLIAAVRGLLATAEPSDAGRVAAAAERALLGRRRLRLTGSVTRLQRAVAAARSGIAFREDTHFHAMRGQPPLRHAVLEAGERLARAGVLEQAADVLHLRLEELEQVTDPAAVGRDQARWLRRLVTDRAARRAALAGAPLISPLTLRPRARRRTGALVTGTPAGGGVARGAVRVVREPRDFDTLQPGEVLVCPYTNPSWTPLFGVAAAVVVDTGGAASHAAIVAREYGIPAVMGTGGGTSTLVDGGLDVVVDGTAGEVRQATSADGRPRAHPG